MIYTYISVAIIYLMALVVLVYYCDSVMECRDSKLKSHLIAIVGFVIYYFIGLYQNSVLNLIGGFAIQFLIVWFGYKITLGKGLFQAVILTVLMMLGEIIASSITDVKIVYQTQVDSHVKDITFIFLSKIIYFLFAMILRQLSSNKDSKYRSSGMIYLIVFPITVCLFLFIFSQLDGEVNAIIEILLIICGIMLIISTVIVYVVFERIEDKNLKIQYLQSIADKQELDNKSYQLMKDKYNDLRIMMHDFTKYCNNIEGMLNQSQCDALNMVQAIKNKNKEFLLVEYTNNTALNVLLSQKMDECIRGNIDFKLYVKDIDLSFIQEFDIVAIFANLIDNAIENCKTSKQRKIFLSINIMNDSYIVIRVDNSADNEPIIINNHLTTWKKDKENHGIGFLSIQKALSKYNGNLQWDYDKETHTFTTIVLINVFNV